MNRQAPDPRHSDGYEESIAPLTHLVDDPATLDLPLGQIPAGEWAILDWLNGLLHATSAPDLQAAITARWDELTLADVHALVRKQCTADTTTTADDLTLARVKALFEAEIKRGLETGVQIAVSYQGSTADLAVGHNGAGLPLTSKSKVPWTCSSKPLGALAFGRLWQRGELDLDTRCCDVLPEFTGGGKEQIRVRDLLGHTTGLGDPILEGDIGQVDVSSWEGVDALLWQTILAAPLRETPGTSMSYSAVANWYILDRVLGKVNGQGGGESFRATMADLGLRADLGFNPSTPPDEQVVPTATPGEEAGLAKLAVASFLPMPGISVWGSCADLRTVGDVLLGRGDECYVQPPVLEAIRATHWVGRKSRSICETDFPYGLGVMTQPTLFGPRCSHRVFGHAGGNTSTLLVDPQHDLVVAVYWNGRLGNIGTFTRRYALVRALYDDLAVPTSAAPHRYEPTAEIHNRKG